MLNLVKMGDEAGGVPLLIVHGLFGSARNWRVLQKRLAQARPVIVVDLRNHGDSFWNADNSYEALAADLAEIIEAHGGVADVLGHSMGGKAAMVLALSRSELVRRLMIADIAPTAYEHTQLPYIDAMQAVDLAGVTRRSDADKQLAMTVESPALRSFFLQSLELGPEGARWQLNLAALKAEMPKIMAFPVVNEVHHGPTLFLRGENSDYIRPEHHPGILRLFPEATFQSLEGAGHWLHAERPGAFLQVVESFLRYSVSG